ncbi:MAG: hypothetical protein JO362_05030 [Streptomycetaceae bacterium]|nr:hypothetical protein [Streptomycetaceae bacterium]
MVKVGIAAAAAVAAGGAIFASQAGAASPSMTLKSFKSFNVKQQKYEVFPSTNVMLKVPQGTTCAYVENYFNNGLRVPLQKTGTEVYDFRALHWNSSAWNSIGVHLVALNVLRVHVLKTSAPCGDFTNSLPSGEGKNFWVAKPSGPWPDDWLDASNAPLHVNKF